MRLAAAFALLSCASLAGAERPALQPDAPIECESCAGWNVEQAPFRIFGNTYFVGVHGLSSVLIVGSKGAILLDGALPQSAPLIEAHIRALGFRVEDVRLIGNSHAHYDHAGGIAALVRDSGGRAMASAEGAVALETGRPHPDDPQAGFGDSARFPSVPNVRRVRDGERIELGDLVVTAHATPGHTPGSTTWTWRSCAGTRCLEIVYADSLNAVSAPGFRFSDPAHPERESRLRRSIADIAALPCDVLVTVHPEFSRIFERVARRAAGEADAVVDASACRAYAADAATRLDARLADERAHPAQEHESQGQ